MAIHATLMQQRKEEQMMETEHVLSMHHCQLVYI
jgi:hypothetical protein